MTSLAGLGSGDGARSRGLSKAPVPALVAVLLHAEAGEETIDSGCPRAAAPTVDGSVALGELSVPQSRDEPATVGRDGEPSR